MRFLSLIFFLLVTSMAASADDRIFVRCEFKEIIDRIDNDGNFPREMLPDCFPSKFDTMCKRAGVRFFAIDDKNIYATFHSREKLVSDGGYFLGRQLLIS